MACGFETFLGEVAILHILSSFPFIMVNLEVKGVRNETNFIILRKG